VFAVWPARLGRPASRLVCLSPCFFRGLGSFDRVWEPLAVLWRATFLPCRWVQVLLVPCLRLFPPSKLQASSFKLLSCWLPVCFLDTLFLLRL
jgi:hypothetical protein